MKKKLILISTCTNNKRVTPHPSCRLDSCIEDTHAGTITQWNKNLKKQQGKIQARQLYSGTHWKETMACVETAKEKGLSPELWILSAGWGLISAEQEICSYSATFSPGEDSIRNLPWPQELAPKEQARLWWAEINRRLLLQAPRTLPELRARFDNAANLSFMLILSKEYFSAIENELIELVTQSAEVIIVSAGIFSEINGAHPLLKDHILPLNDKFKQADDYLNKTNVSLNARLATWIISNHHQELLSGLPCLHRTIKEIEESLPEMKRRNVVKMTDEEVISFIDKHYEPGTSTATRLLRALRHEEEKSCEQKRFGRLFKQYVTKQSKQGLLSDE